MKYSVLSFIFVSFLFSPIISWSQKSEWGIELGTGLSSFQVQEDREMDIKALPAAAIGIYRQFTFPSSFGLKAELMLSSKGGRKSSVGVLYLHQIFLYTQLRATTLWELRCRGVGHFFLGAGPHADLLLLAFNEINRLEDIRRMDFGFQLVLGYQWTRYSLFLQAESGVLNMDLLASERTYRHGAISLVIGRSFH